MKEFKLIVAGSRGFNDYGLLSKTLFSLAETTYKDVAVSIVSGMARGADALASDFARQHGVTLYEFPADWNAYGKRAGFLRNEAMGRFADGLLAFWDGESNGTRHMISFMENQSKPVHTQIFVTDGA